MRRLLYTVLTLSLAACVKEPYPANCRLVTFEASICQGTTWTVTRLEESVPVQFGVCDKLVKELHAMQEPGDTYRLPDGRVVGVEEVIYCKCN